MLFKKPVIFLLSCFALLHDAVTVEAVTTTTTSQWTGQEWEVYSPLQVSSYSCPPEWISKSWDFLTIKMWVKWGKGYYDKENAKTCLDILTIILGAQDGPKKRYNFIINNQCYCGYYFDDDQVSGGVARTTIKDAKDHIDEWGVPKPGHVAYTTINGHRDERFGVAVHCNSDPSRVAHQVAALSGNHEPTGDNPCASTSRYGSIAPMII